jgi:hypothetical protein
MNFFKNYFNKKNHHFYYIYWTKKRLIVIKEWRCIFGWKFVFTFHQDSFNISSCESVSFFATSKIHKTLNPSNCNWFFIFLLFLIMTDSLHCVCSHPFFCLFVDYICLCLLGPKLIFSFHFEDSVSCFLFLFYNIIDQNLLHLIKKKTLIICLFMIVFFSLNVHKKLTNISIHILYIILFHWIRGKRSIYMVDWKINYI